MKKQDIDSLFADEDDSPTEHSEKEENLPVVMPSISENIGYQIEVYTPIDEQHSDKETTESNLNVINNHLAMINGMLPHLKTIDSVFKSSLTAIKLIECQRKVKKLEYGKPQKGGLPFEALE